MYKYMNDYVIPEGWERIPVGGKLQVGDKYTWETNRPNISSWRDAGGETRKTIQKDMACCIRKIEAKKPIALKTADVAPAKAVLRAAPTSKAKATLKVADEAVVKPKAKVELKVALVESPKSVKAKPIELKVAVDKIRPPVTAGSPVLRSAPPAAAVVAPEAKAPVQPLIPQGWRQLQSGELYKAGDKWIGGPGGDLDESKWNPRSEGGIGLSPSRSCTAIRKVEEVKPKVPVLRTAPVEYLVEEDKLPVFPDLRGVPTKETQVGPVKLVEVAPQVEFQIPHGWHLLNDEELIEEGDRWISVWDDDKGSLVLADWSEVVLEDIGDTPSETTPCIRANARPVKAAPPKVEAPKAVECVIPSGWARLSPNVSIMATDRWIDKKEGSEDLRFWSQCAGGALVSVAENWGNVVIRKIPTIEHVEPDVVVEKVVLKVASPSPVNNGCSTEKKECVNMSIPLRSASAAVAAAAGNGVLGGLFNTLKASAINATKTAASTTLAEKITDLVLARLPVGVRAMAGVLPRPVLIFAVSTAVYAAALKFDIPGRDRVRDISKYATDGSMYEAARLAMGLLEPLFAAIREMVPSDLGALINEAHQS